VDLAPQFCVGARNASRSKHAVQRHGSFDDVLGRTPLGDRFDLSMSGERVFWRAARFSEA
jgi:hypothetical protein